MTNNHNQTEALKVAQQEVSEREAFEKWHTRVDKSFKRYSAFNSIEIAAAWDAWQARAALGQPSAPAEPVAMSAEVEMILDDLEQGDLRNQHGEGTDIGQKAAKIIRKLIRRAAPVAAPVVPDGWKLVPIEPTEEMIAAWFDTKRVDPVETAVERFGPPYRAMLSAVPVAQAVPDTAGKDAERWRALIGSARIRPLGCAGIKEREARNYAHLGLELWTVFGDSLNDEQRERLAKENALGREWLTAYADIAAISAAKNPDERGSEG